MSRDQWASEVRMMVQEGAKLTDVEFTQTVDYLAKAFPAGRDTTPADRGRAVYMSQCATCHGPRRPKLVGKEIGPFLKKVIPCGAANPPPTSPNRRSWTYLTSSIRWQKPNRLALQTGGPQYRTLAKESTSLGAKCLHRIDRGGATRRQ